MKNKLIVVLMTLLAVCMFAGSAMAADVFSTSVGDYSYAVRVSPSGETYTPIVYGRLLPAVKYKSLPMFKDNTSLGLPDSTKAQIANEKIAAVYAGYMSPIYIPVVCENILKSDSDTKGDLFRCVYPVFLTNGKTKSELESNLKSSAESFHLASASNDGLIMTQALPSSTLMGNGTDTDGDSVPDSIDNCASILNFSQEDSDLDGTGDACKTTTTTITDQDSDGIADSEDNCPSVANADQADSDENGVGDACETTTSTTTTTTTTTPASSAGEGGMCTMLPAAAFNPVGAAFILAALAIVVRRRMR